MRRADFHYELPEELIAQVPRERRADARLLHLDCARGTLADRRMEDLPALLAPGDLLVFNDTRVLKARLLGRKPGGGRAEVLIERILGERHALALLRAARTPRTGAAIAVAEGVRIVVGERNRDGLWRVEVVGGTVCEVLERHGHVPLPPYIRRDAAAFDEERYQTVFARRPGAVAAPTAALHFDDSLLGRLRARGVDCTWITLHVGYGTFAPVRAERIEQHRMHRERFEVGTDACRRIEAARAAGGRVVAVGTTTVRALETAAAGGRLRPVSDETDIFITPGHRFRTVDAIITNFHLPESTLLMLVAAYAGRSRVLAAYRHAVAERYRFFSYGDAMLLTGGPVAPEAAGA